MSEPTPEDVRWMRRAIELAPRGWGRVAPNPLVGSVIVRDGQAVGEGWHAEYGRPHAEVEALRAAGERARGATAYVSLEPCAHWGKTPPCTDALVAAGVGRVVFAAYDPKAGFCGSLGNLVQDPRLNHRLAVEGGYMEERSRDMLQEFFRTLRKRDRMERWQSG